MKWLNLINASPHATTIKWSIIVGIATFIIGTGLYAWGVHLKVKSDLNDANTKIGQLENANKSLSLDLKTLKNVNAANQETISKILEDNRLAADIMKETAKRNAALKAEKTQMEILLKKYSADDRELSPVMREALLSIPGATK